MKLKSCFLILLVALSLTGCSNSQKEKELTNTDANETNTQYTRTSFNETVANTSNETINSTTGENAITNTSNPSQEDLPSATIAEEELASFSTKIYTKDAPRQNNLELTCSKLNGTTVAPGETFSFTDTIGPSTTAKGYQEADIFDSNGNKKKGLGGGNCQVSSTLYNAVLGIPSLTVIERHEHSNKVPYVKPGLDAAVAYGSVDLKFKNTNSFAIKIYAEATKSNVLVRIVK